MITPIISICIPTNERLHILKNTLDSIYIEENIKYLSEFEVVISDNAQNDNLLLILDSYKQYNNLSYHRADCEGFMNSVNALKCGRGLFLKLHNNHSIVCNNFIGDTIDFLKKNIENKPQVFFSNKSLKEGNILEFQTFDSFVYKLTYFNTWSSGFSIWKEDFEQIINEPLDHFFPQTSLLMKLSKKNKFYINDKDYFIGQNIPGKGGYNIFKVFTVNYLNILSESIENDIISKRTFRRIKKDLMNVFLVESYYNLKIIKTEHTFDLSEIRESFKNYYPSYRYFTFLMQAYLYALKRIIINSTKYFLSLLGLKPKKRE